MGHIQRINAGIVCGCLIDTQGTPFYFVREAIDSPESERSWDMFHKAMETYTKVAVGLAFLKQLPHRDAVAEMGALYPDIGSAVNLESVSNALMDTGRPGPAQRQSTSSLLRASVGALAGFRVSRSRDDERRFVAYVSTRPVLDSAMKDLFGLDPHADFGAVLERTKHIIMFVGNGVSEGCSEHRGISKTPPTIVKGVKVAFPFESTHVHLSMALHFFLMKSHKNEGVPYFTAAPMDKMNEIILSTLKRANLKPHFACGRDEITKRGWDRHVREAEADDQPLVGEMRDMEVPLWVP